MVKVDAREVARAPVNVTTPAVVPQKQARCGGAAPAAAKRAATFEDRDVVAKATAPPPPPSFAKEHEAIQANGGKPISISQVRQLQPEQPKAAVRIAPPAGQVTPPTNADYRPGQPRNKEDGHPGQQTKVEMNNNRPSTPSSGNERPNAQPNKPTGNDRNDQPASVRPSNPNNDRPNAQPNKPTGNERNDQPASVRPSNPNNDRPNAQPNKPT